MQPLENCIGPTIRNGREILCLPYAGFLKYGWYYMHISRYLVSTIYGIFGIR